MKNYIPKSTKSKEIQAIINEALDILESVVIPVDKTERALESYVHLIKSNYAENLYLCLK